MSISRQRFLHQVNLIESIINKNKHSDNIVDGVYFDDLRTPLFMIQGLSRLYQPVYKNEESFEKIKKQSKELEDAIGQYDYVRYTIESLKKLSDYASLQSHCEKIEKHAYQHVNEILEKGKWLNEKRISKWRKRLSAIQWLSEEKETTKLKISYQNEIAACQNFISQLTSPLEDMESQVHELRRKLRWLSIYVQATRGLFFLETDAERDYRLRVFQIKKIMASPFVQLEKNDSLKNHIALGYADFIALSWIIYHLGELKDRGLLQWELSQILLEVNMTKVVDEKIRKDMGWTEHSTDMILSESEKVINKFMRYNVLENLIFKAR